MLNITKIHPDDLNKNTTIGIAFPLMEGGIFKPTQTFKEQVKSNIIHTLMTQKGELVNRPDFGIGLKHLIFEQNVDTEQLEMEIKNQFDMYIPEIELGVVTAEFLEADHLIYIKIGYTIKFNAERDAVQVNVGIPQSLGGRNVSLIAPKPKVIKRSAIVNASR
jgi:phage baseplate assembly protein W|tara:strand:- start:6481 stop:6969 length:489 start_codon:yes stop_codon:yes gene_type:complete